MRRTLSFASAAVALFAASCLPGPDSGTQGELGNGNFQYLCAGPSDVTCDDGNDQHPLPEAVAMDADLKVLFVPLDLGTDAFVRSASSDLLEEKTSDATGTMFHTQKEGVVAVLAKRQEKLVDYAHLKILEAKTARVESVDNPAQNEVTSLELDAGASAQIRVVPLDVNNEKLAGALACAWTSSDEGVATVASDPADDTVTIQGVNGGTATIHVSLGALSADVTVTVLGGAGTGGTGGGGAGGGGAGGAGGGV